MTYWEIKGRNCTITIEPRPEYCDQGNYIAKVFEDGTLGLDEQDGWPRYYFNIADARSECVCWLKKREQYLPDTTWIAREAP